MGVGEIPAFMIPKISKLVNVRPGTKLFFKRSNFEKDLSQRLVPALDIQPIEIKPHTAFDGAGFMLKIGDENSGGYLALKLLARDLSEDVKKLFSKESFKKQKINV